jgi:hypothetical protein
MYDGDDIGMLRFTKILRQDHFVTCKMYDELWGSKLHEAIYNFGEPQTELPHVVSSLTRVKFEEKNLQSPSSVGVDALLFAPGGPGLLESWTGIQSKESMRWHERQPKNYF